VAGIRRFLAKLRLIMDIRRVTRQAERGKITPEDAFAQGVILQARRDRLRGDR
jgi:hypothetical protein